MWIKYYTLHSFMESCLCHTKILNWQPIFHFHQNAKIQNGLKLTALGLTLYTQ